MSPRSVSLRSSPIHPRRSTFSTQLFSGAPSMYPASCCVGSTTQTLTHQTVHPAIHPESPREPQRAGMDLLDFLVWIYCFHCSCLLFHCFALLFLMLFIYCFIVSDLLHLCFCCFRGVDVCVYLCVVCVFYWLSGDVCKNCLRIFRMVPSESHRKHPESPRELQRAQESPRELVRIYWFS
jgi:hypothetical protein